MPFFQDLLKQNPSSWQEISLVCYFFFTLMLLQLCKVSTGFSSCLLCTKNTQKLLQILNAVNTNEVSKKIIQLARVHFVLLYPSGIRKYVKNILLWPNFIFSDIISAHNFAQDTNEEEKLQSQSSTEFNWLFWYLYLLKSHPLKFLC